MPEGVEHDLEIDGEPKAQGVRIRLDAERR